VPALLGCGRADWHLADERLNLAVGAAREDGFVPMRGPHNTFGTFSDAGSQTWRVHLDPHQPYFLAAACAPSCDSLNFQITDSNHDEVFADTSAGPTPRLMFTPIEGNLRVTFTHGPCLGGGRCRWIAQLYERRTAPQ
jgi:hypothetical protein